MTDIQQFKIGAERRARAAKLRRAAEAELASAAPDFLQRFALQAYINELEQHGRPHRFYEFTPRTLELTKQMHAAYPSTTVEIFNRLLLAHLIETAESRQRTAIIPTVQPYVREDLDRILKGLERPRAGYYVRDNHLFRRDLAIARLKVIPNGFELYDVNTGIARKDMMPNLRAAIRSLLTFREDLFGPLHPLYEPHWDRRYVRYFSPEEYERCCLRIADMMVANPEVRGVATRSWWCDPQLKDISPELYFIRDIAEGGGARFMLLEEDNRYTLSDALAFSQKRKELYEAGKYIPRTYMIYWPRREMIAWAGRTRRERPDLETGAVPCTVA